MKEVYLKRNKYIRLRIVKAGYTYRSDISINKYTYDKNQERYYEINFAVFSPYDYSSEEKTFEKAEEWLYEELKELQTNVNLNEVSE